MCCLIIVRTSVRRTHSLFFLEGSLCVSALPISGGTDSVHAWANAGGHTVQGSHDKVLNPPMRPASPGALAFALPPHDNYFAKMDFF